jgi:uncharacterized protein (DUF305 family)
MRINWQLAVLSIIFFALAMQGWRWAPEAHADSAPRVDPEWSALMDSMHRMDAAMMAVAPSGKDDADFVKLMLPHHQAAIDMAKAQLLYGKDPQMQRLAQEIITDQQSEIELMRRWLKQHESSSSKADTPAVRASMER